jgi:uncharacterized metal-binding protein
MKVENNVHSSPALIFACYGASDVGELADRTARRLKKSGLGKMYCLAAIGGHIKQFIDDTQSAKDVIIIDGCSNGCAKKTLSTINVQGREFDLETIGFQKGESPATGDNIKKVITHMQLELG